MFRPASRRQLSDAIRCVPAVRLGEILPEAGEQRCWNHRLTNVIDQLSKKEWPAARALLRKIPYAETRSECERLRDQFATRYQKLFPKAVETLGRDWERMVTFYRFPKDHWTHLRTTNPVESPFSAVRLRTDQDLPDQGLGTGDLLVALG
jgi:putative transposase